VLVRLQRNSLPHDLAALQGDDADKGEHTEATKGLWSTILKEDDQEMDETAIVQLLHAPAEVPHKKWYSITEGKQWRPAIRLHAVQWRAHKWKALHEAQQLAQQCPRWIPHGIEWQWVISENDGMMGRPQKHWEATTNMFFHWEMAPPRVQNPKFRLRRD
jgi:hypothetical protein